MSDFFLKINVCIGKAWIGLNERQNLMKENLMKKGQGNDWKRSMKCLKS